METKDLLELQALTGRHDMSAYEQFKVGHMQSKRASGTAIGALAVGVGAAVVGIAGALWAGSRANAAKEVAAAKNDGLRDLVLTQAQTIAAERAERIQGDQTITQTVNDTVSGSQQGTLTAQQQAELSAVNSVMTKSFENFVEGKASLNPTPVSIFSAPQPCGCPGCGCNR